MSIWPSTPSVCLTSQQEAHSTGQGQILLLGFQKRTCFLWFLKSVGIDVCLFSHLLYLCLVMPSMLLNNSSRKQKREIRGKPFHPPQNILVSSDSGSKRLPSCRHVNGRTGQEEPGCQGFPCSHLLSEHHIVHPGWTAQVPAHPDVKKA